jgi:K+-transporting ATPase KdpF subunit
MSGQRVASALWQVDEEQDMFEWIAGILTIGLLAYLAVALLKPEWFA